MNEIEITPRELMYIASGLGATEFFGLPDPFMGMTPEEIRSAVEEARLSLDRRGYAEMDFSGDFHIGSAAGALVRVCAFCSRCVSVDRVHAGDGGRLLLYLLDGDMVAIFQEGVSLRLRECGVAEAREYLIQKIGDVSDTADFPAAAVTYEEMVGFRAALAAAPDGAGAANKEKSYSEVLSAILADGFGRNGDLSLMVATDFEKNLTDVLMLLRTDAGSAELTRTDDRSGWIIKPAAQKTVLDWVRSSLPEARKECDEDDR